MFRREASLFVPSGTMGNLTSIVAHTRPGQEVICEETGHVYNYEMASMCAIAGVLPRVVAGQDGILSWESIASAIRPKVYYRPQTALIALENTHNMAGGTVYPVEVADEICDKAHAAGIHVHLDGARVFNAATYLKANVADITQKFDSVQFCVSKGLGAPVGSLIVGSREFIETVQAHSQDAGRRDASGRRSGRGCACRAERRSWTPVDRSRECQASGAGSGVDSRDSTGSEQGANQYRDFWNRGIENVFRGIS